MPGNQIVIDLGEVWADERTATDAIIERAAALLISDYELKRKIQQHVEAISDEEIREHLKPLFAEALVGAIQPTDAFGHPKGQPTTLREIIVKQVEKELHGSVRRDSYRSSETLIDQIVGREVQKVVGEDLRAAMEEARAQVREAVKAKGAEVLAETIRRLA